jgi:hypothetical protein
MPRIAKPVRSGEKFGHLICTGKQERREVKKHGRRLFAEVRCECGNITWKQTTVLRSGYVKSCGRNCTVGGAKEAGKLRRKFTNNQEKKICQDYKNGINISMLAKKYEASTIAINNLLRRNQILVRSTKETMQLESEKRYLPQIEKNPIQNNLQYSGKYKWDQYWGATHLLGLFKILWGTKQGKEIWCPIKEILNGHFTGVRKGASFILQYLSEFHSIIGHRHSIFIKKAPAYVGMPFYSKWDPNRGGSYETALHWLIDNLGPRPASDYHLHIINRQLGFVPNNLMWVPHDRHRQQEMIAKQALEIQQLKKALAKFSI